MGFVRFFTLSALTIWTGSSQAESLDKLDSSKIQGFSAKSCQLRASRSELRAPALFEVPGPTSTLKTTKLEWDAQTSIATGSVDNDKYLLQVHSVPKVKLPAANKDAQKYLEELRKVSFLTVEVTDTDGNDVQIRNFDHDKVNSVALHIGNYNGVFFEPAASNVSSKNMIVIHDRVARGAQKTFSRITVHCDLDVQYKN